MKLNLLFFFLFCFQNILERFSILFMYSSQSLVQILTNMHKGRLYVCICIYIYICMYIVFWDKNRTNFLFLCCSSYSSHLWLFAEFLIQTLTGIYPSSFTNVCFWGVWVIWPLAPISSLQHLAPGLHKSFNKLNLLLVKVQSL